MWLGRLLILMYHRVLPQPDPFRPGDPDIRAFDRQMSALARCCRVLPLGEALERLDRGALPAGAAAITFDDGYRDNYRHALPVLQRYGLQATVCVAPGFLDETVMWNDAIIEAVRAAPGDALDLHVAGLGRY